MKNLSDARQVQREAKENWVWVSQARNLLENYYSTLCEQGEKTRLPTGTTMRRLTNEIREIADRIDAEIGRIAPDQSVDSRVLKSVGEK